jgi:hypothetical protein
MSATRAVSHRCPLAGSDRRHNGNAVHEIGVELRPPTSSSSRRVRRSVDQQPSRSRNSPQPVLRFRERTKEDDETCPTISAAAGGMRQCAPIWPSFRGGATAPNPESRGSGFIAPRCPGTTVREGGSPRHGLLLRARTVREVADHHVEDRREQQPEQSDAEHAEKHGDANCLAHL